MGGRNRGSLHVAYGEPGMEFFLTFLPRKFYIVCPEKITITVPDQTHLFDQSKEINSISL
jgi:hypothetical protein